MDRNTTFLIAGVLAVTVVVLGYLYYQERQKTAGVEISVGQNSISINKR